MRTCGGIIFGTLWVLILIIVIIMILTVQGAAKP